MSKTTPIRDVMEKNPVTLSYDSTIAEAARCMRDKDIGNVLVLKNGKLSGIVTDRDIVVRAIAQDKDTHSTKLGEICSDELATLSPEDTVDNAVNLMRKKAIRRIPIVENDKPVGIVSIGDLAISEDRSSALGGISAASPNH